MDGTLLSKSLIQFSVDGRGCVPLLLLDLRSNYGGGNEDNLLGKKVMTNLDSILKSRDITLPTKVRLVKAMAFPVVMYGIEKGKERKGKSFSRVCLCDPMDCSPPGFSIHGIFQARVLEWVAISFSNGIESWTIKKTECPRIDAFELW